MKNKKVIALLLITALFFSLFSNLLIKEKFVMAQSENGIVVLKLDSGNEDGQGLRYTLDSDTYLAKVSGQSILDYDADIQIPDAVEDENGILYRVNELASDLFEGCTMIRSLRLSESIACFNFYSINNSSCKELYFGQNASTIYPGGTSKLEKISVSDFNTCLVMENGVLFNKDKTVLMKAPYKMEQVNTYEVPDSVNYIYEGAFDGVKYAYSWKNQPEEKEYNTFYLDENKKDEQGLSYEYHSGGIARAYVAKGDEVDVEELVIPDYVYFTDETSAYRLPVGLVDGGVGENTQKLSIGSKVQTIGESLFSEAHSLKTIEVDSRNRDFYVDDQGVLYSVSKDTIYRVPVSIESYSLPEEVETVGAYCFAYTDLKDFEFNRNKLYKIRMGAFVQTGITQLYLPNVIKISMNAFEKCTKLKWVVFGGREVDVGTNVFRNCSRIEAVLLPKISSFSQENYIFYNCVSLQKCIILRGLSFLGQNCFYNTKIDYMVLPQECTGIQTSLQGAPTLTFDYLKEIYFPKECEVRPFLRNDDLEINAYYPPGGKTESQLQACNSVLKLLTTIAEKDHEHTYEKHIIYTANGLTISADRCTDCYKQVSYQAETPDGTVTTQYDFYKEPIVQSIVKNHSGATSDPAEPTASSIPSVKPTASASAKPTTPGASASAKPTRSPMPDTSAKSTESPLPDTDVKPTESPAAGGSTNVNGNSVTGESENKQDGTKQLSSAKKQRLKITPVISAKRKKSGKIKYINIRLKKYQGSYIEIYAGKKNKLHKIGGKAFSIKKYKKSFNVKYSKKKQVLYIKVRTYKKVKNKKIYSRYSKTIKVRT